MTRTKKLAVAASGLYLGIFAIGVALAGSAVPCPGQAPLSAVKPKRQISESTDPNPSTGYLLADAPNNKTQVSASWSNDKKETGKAECENEYWKVVVDPCAAATGGTNSCTWLIQWQLKTTATLLKATAVAGSGFLDTAQGYAHVKIFSEDGSSSTKKSVNAYSTSSSDPSIKNKNNEIVLGPVDAKNKKVGEHIAGSVESFSKYVIDDSGTADADAVYTDAQIIVQKNILVSGTCGTQ